MTLIKNLSEWFLKPRIVCGVMTGTSLDGIDISLAKFSSRNNKHSFELLFWDTLEFPIQTKELIIKILNENVPVSLISKLNFEIARTYSSSIKSILKINDFPIHQIDAVGIHGQTIWHNPPTIDNHYQGDSYQISSISALANILGITVVGDFRSADVALGGQGAPLVPIFDYEFLSNNNSRDSACRVSENVNALKNVIALNIGGMSNVTYLPANCRKDAVVAFDTGHGNVLIDSYIKKFYKQNYDQDGLIASSGELIKSLLDDLMNIEFIKKNPPKSTGRELFNINFVNSMLSKYENKYKIEDLINTLTNFTAESISFNIRKFCGKTDLIYVSGGGIHNKYLMYLLKEKLFDIEIRTIADIGIPADAKESICFAYLAYRTLGGLCSNLPAVTGASRETILGTIAFV